MSPEILLALVGFSIATSITPGPNNLMLLASGVNYGFKRTIPHMLGIAGGFSLLLAGVGLGLGQILQVYPPLFIGMKIAGGTYLVYLAYRIATSGPVESNGGKGSPLTFVQAAAFQWVNPKAWMMAVTAMTTYIDETQFALTVSIIVFVFAAINLPCVSSWCAFGTAMRNFLQDEQRLKIFNWFMAALLIASLWPMLN